ncbi:FCD domain-containing protein [Pseudomonas sp. CES]|uniref:FadR/GntR family transcriptional regulator n=1 Tax=Pseudomonas sp. CES TaxID=2719586 RepID=UPI002113FDB7|nr:FCD domain-containing protein [Pseudomonas sp. CES]
MNDTSASTASFMRLRQEGRTEEVVRRLIEVIDLGLFAEGEQLPSETELSMQFGVATVTLREALALLRERGLIETRRGRNGGSFVCPYVEMPAEHLISRLQEMSALELRDFSDEHAAISGAAARLAAKRASPEHLDRLQHYVDALITAETRTERRRADARFHIEIGVAAQSVRLTHAEMNLQTQIGELLWVSLPDDIINTTAICSEHQAIADAISSGDATLAGALAEAHVNRGIKRLIDLRLALVASEVA